MKKTTLALIPIIFFAQVELKNGWKQVGNPPDYLYFSVSPTAMGQYGDKIMMAGDFVPEGVTLYNPATKTREYAGSLPRWSNVKGFFWSRIDGRYRAYGRIPDNVADGDTAFYGAYIYNPIGQNGLPEWIPDPEWKFTGLEAADQIVYTVVNEGITDVAGGVLYEINDVPVRYVARFQGVWTSVFKNIFCSNCYVGPLIQKLLAGPDGLYIFGRYTSIETHNPNQVISANNAGRFNGFQLTPLSVPHPLGEIMDATFFRDMVLITGYFPSGVLKLTGTAWEPFMGGVALDGRAILNVRNGVTVLGKKNSTSTPSSGTALFTDGNNSWENISPLDKEKEVFSGGFVDTVRNDVYGWGPLNPSPKLRVLVRNFGGAPAPLPIKLKSFTASVQDEKVLLKWEADMTEDRNQFTVERSMDGTVFNTIATLEGRRTETRYSLLDAPGKGTFYYRLRFDGKYSKVIAVSIKQGDKPVIKSGNGMVYIINLNGMLQVINSTGQTVLRPQRISGSETISLPRGIYVISLIDDKGKRYSQRVSTF